MPPILPQLPARRPWTLFALLLLAAALLLLFAGPALAQSGGMTVTTFDDVRSGRDGLCSLREAVVAANTNRASGRASGECVPERRGADTIRLPAGLYKLSIKSVWWEQLALTGDLDIRGDLTIEATGEGLTVIAATYDDDRVVEIVRGKVTLRGLTITGGDSTYSGGGIYNRGTLNLENSTLTGNKTRFGGGGLYNRGSAQLTNVTISGNEAGWASGIWRGSGKVNVRNTLVAGDACGGKIDARSGASNNLAFNAPGCETADFGLRGDPGLSPQFIAGLPGTAVLFAIDAAGPAADAADSGLCPSADQRGVARPQGDGCDIGAFEAEQASGPGVPTARADTYDITEDQPLTVAAPGLLGNDDANGSGPLTVALSGPAPAGDLTLNPDGSFSYTPPRQQVGSDSFSYTASGSGQTSAPALVTITTAEDGLIEVTNTCDAGPGSLRAAIAKANSQAGTDTIIFDIVDTSCGTQTINVDSALPALTEPVVIDGLAQDVGPDRTAAFIVLNGQGGAFSGFDIPVSGAGSVIRGLIILDFGGSGIVIGRDGPSSGNLIEKNTISGNGGGAVSTGGSPDIPLNDGITILDGVQNLYPANTFSGNSDLDVDLGGDGSTPNDPGDGDGGANLTQNFPLLLQAYPSAANTVTVEGWLYSTPNAAFDLRFFAGSTCDSGDEIPLGGPSAVTTANDGSAFFTIQLPDNLNLGQGVRATAADADGNTSELSNCVAASRNNNTWITAWRLSPYGSEQVINQFLNVVGESRWYKFKVTPNSKVRVRLDNLPADYDITVYKDIAQAYADLANPSDLNRLNAEFASDAVAPSALSPSALSPSALSPSALSPSALSPSAFSPSALSPSALSPSALSPSALSPDAISPSALSPSALSPSALSPSAFSPSALSPSALSPEIYSSAQSRSLIGVSALDGTAPELLAVNTWNNDGDFYVRVRGREGAFDPNNTFRLTVFVESGVCEGLYDDLFDAQGNSTLPGRTLGNSGSGNNTLFVADWPRMTAEYGAAEVGALQSKINALAGRPEVKGTILNVANDARVAAATALADQYAECPAAKNLVASSIKDVVDQYTKNQPIKYIVLLGSDRYIPFFRYPDNALLGPESDYVPPVLDSSASQASLQNNMVLGQDEYGADVTISYKDDEIPLPKRPVGRLVETPQEIITVIDAYLSTTGGVVPTPQNVLVTGYDFLYDAALEVQEELELGTNSTADTLLTPSDKSPLDPASWTAFDLADKIDQNRYDIAFLAGHFSANTALAADFATGYFSTDLAGNSVDMTNSIFFSAGCHSGYNIPFQERVPGVTVEPDWAQAFAAKGATLIAGTGYQYGDTDFVEYGERLYLNFARELRTGNGPVAIGDAFVRAKQDYLAETPSLRGIHEKTLLISTIYGLPFLKVDMPGTRLAPQNNASVVPNNLPVVGGVPGSVLGLRTYDLTVNAQLTPRSKQLVNVDDNSTVTASWLEGSAGVLTNPGEPALPLETRNVTVPNLVLRGVGFRGGDYQDVANVQPLVGAPTTELRAIHLAFVSNVFFPLRPWSVNYFDVIENAGGVTRLNVAPAQYLSEDPAPGSATLRRFSQMDFRLYYSGNIDPNAGNAPGLAAAPTIVRVDSRVNGTDIDFLVQVVTNPGIGIQETWVTYSAFSGPYAGEWASLNLTQDPNDSTLWKGKLPANGTTPSDIFFMAQTAGGNGLVTRADNLGRYYSPAGDIVREATSLSLLGGPSSGALGTKVTLGAELRDASGAALANQVVSVALGRESRIGRTNANGRVSVEIPVIGAPGDVDITATFNGTTLYLPSSAGNPRTFTIVRQGTVLTLSPGSATIDEGQNPPFEALLEDVDGRPLAQQTVVFRFAPPGGSPVQRAAITDLFGTARVQNLDLPAGTYNVRADFDGTGSFLADSSGTSTLTVNEVNPSVVRLRDSSGAGLDGATAAYYQGSWQTIPGTTDANGELPYTLPPGTYPFRITYKGASIQKSQDIAANPTVEFATVNVTVELRDSSGAELPGGSAEFYAGSWQPFPATDANGRTSLELLPREYTFAMMYEGGRVNQVQDVSGEDNTVSFATANVTVELRDSSGAELPGGAAEFYAGSWRPFPPTGADGRTSKELLPREYTFAMVYKGARVSQVQDVSGENTTVSFQTTNVIAELLNGGGAPLPGGAAEFYAGTWQTFPAVTGADGRTSTQLLPAEYTFAMTYDGERQTRVQSVGGTTAVVSFTVLGDDPVVTPGFDPNAGIAAIAKFRNFATGAAGFDVQLGTEESVGSFTQYDSGSSYPYGSSNAISFSYDGTNLTVVHPVSSGTGSQPLMYTPAVSLGNLDYLQIEVACREGAGTAVALRNVTLDGFNLGDFVAPSCGTNADSFAWQVTNIDLTSSFTITATLEISGFSGLTSQEKSKVVIRAGSTATE